MYAGKEHVPHAADHPARPEDPASHVRTFPSASQSFWSGRPRGASSSLRRDVVELETGVAGVHVEVDSVAAAGGDHPEREVLGRDAGAVEVADEVVLREADGAPRAVDFVRPSRRRAAPPVATPGVELPVLDERREVLPESDDVVRAPRVESGHVPKAFDPSRSSATSRRRAWAASTRCRSPASRTRRAAPGSRR